MTSGNVAYPPYEAPILTVDALVLQFIDNRPYVLLVKRKRDPFAGMYALPGVYTPRGETTHQAFNRVLRTKAGLDEKGLGFVHQLYASDTIARDPRGHAVSIVYVGLGRDLAPVSANAAEDPQFFPIDELPKLAFDHAEIIANAMAYLGTSIMDVRVVSALLPEKFTLTRLQSVYEVLLGQALDKRNFRKKIAALDLVEATAEYHASGAHRPAQLYRFTQSAVDLRVRAFM